MAKKNARQTFWKNAAIAYIAFALIVGFALNTNSMPFALFALVPLSYLIWGTGAKCPNCHTRVQQVRQFFAVPWCPKSCFTCGKNLSRPC